jgi:hypothetical protein
MFEIAASMLTGPLDPGGGPAFLFALSLLFGMALEVARVRGL